jgi:tRNA nucleotidyltransferase (CCA-adding enzyme)
MLLHDIGKPLVHTTDSAGVDHFKTHQLKSAKLSREITGALKLDNRSRSRIYDLVLEHDTRIPPVKRSVRRLMSKYDDSFFDDYLSVRRADTLAQSEYMREQKLAELDAIGDIAQQIRKEQLCIHISDLAVNGNDLIALGYEGSDIGKALKLLLDGVIEERTKNEKNALIAYIKENFK